MAYDKKRPVKRLTVCLLGIGFAGTLVLGARADAMGLLEVYNAALQNDPAYQSAIHDNEAGRENRVLGRANLLPTVSADYSGSKNKAEQTQPDAYGNPFTTHPNYVSSQADLTLRQPIYSPDGVAKYHEGIAQADYSDAQFSGKQQDLVLRVVEAYCNALLAQEQLSLAVAQRDAFAEQRAVNDHMFALGEGTKTDMLETQAKLDLAEAQLIEARDNHTTYLQALEAMVGREVTQLDGLADGFQVKPLQPVSFDEWRTLALKNNPEIQAQRFVVEASQQEVYRNRAGHLPHVDFVASLSKEKADNIDYYTTDSMVRSAGIQVTVPIYSGGSVNASTRQASAGLLKAKSDLDDQINKTLLDLHKQHYAVMSGSAKIGALVKSVDSARLLVTATKQSIKGGVRVNVDLLNAEQQLYSAQRDLAQARYTYLIADLTLRSDAGMLTANDLRNVAAYFSKAQ
ncbi:MAG: TolC family outer membrane protein [Burkholderiaceae bacterium]|nr:TolC family outer membrane protein [Burkholderiaceae bacterium]